MNFEELIAKSVDIIESNRISSTETADALGKSGVLPGFQPINTGKFLAGRVHYVYAHNESNWPIHEQIINMPENCVLYVDAFRCDNKAIFGDLVTKYIILYKKAKGIVVNGLMRDISDLRKYGFPIWCKGFTPLGCFNLQVEEDEEIRRQVETNRAYFQDGIVVCDDTGVTFIKKEQVNEEMYQRLELIELQEDIWSFCINTLKWSTYDTVCLKRYLTNPEVLPETLRERVKSIPFKK